MNYLYRIGIESLDYTLSDADIGDEIVGNIEEYRLFNRSYYDNVSLAISARITESNKTNIQITIDGSRLVFNKATNSYEWDLRAKTRRESLTTMINIGGENPYTHKKYEAKTDTLGHDTETPVNPNYNEIEVASGNYTGWSGDYLILYNNVITP